MEEKTKKGMKNEKNEGMKKNKWRKAMEKKNEKKW